MLKTFGSLLVAAALLEGESAAPPEAGEEPFIESSAGIEIDPVEDGICRVRLPLTGGRLVVGDLLRALARAKGFDDAALGGVLPGRTIDLRSKGGRLVLAGLNLSLAPRLELRVLPPASEGGSERLEIALDPVALLASKRWIKRRIRDAFLRMFRDRRRDYGLQIDSGWEDRDREKDVVVLVAGLHAAPEKEDPILEDLRLRGFPCGAFVYPNDQPIADSAARLAGELSDLRRMQPERRVTLIAHSMGGLVAREAIENPMIDPGNVRRLIQVAPPNQGSVLAHYAFALEVWEHAAHERDRPVLERFFSAVEDGLGEAATDLRPGSVFLKALNARARNPRVEYSIFIGSRGPLDEAALERLRSSLKKAGGRNRFVRFFGPKLDQHLADLREVLRGEGDGAVAIERARLGGVEDVEILDFDHVSIWKKPGDPGSRLLREKIIAKVEASRR